MFTQVWALRGHMISMERLFRCKSDLLGPLQTTIRRTG